MGNNKTKLAEAKVRARKQIEDFQNAIRRVGQELLTARRDAWLENQELEKKLQEKLDNQHETLEEVFETTKNLNRLMLAQLLFDAAITVVGMLAIMTLAGGF